MGTNKLVYVPKKYVCSTCGVEKPGTEFYYAKGVRQARCKECDSIVRKCKIQEERTRKFAAKERLRALEDNNYTVEDWRAAMLWFRGACCYCGEVPGRAKKEKFDREHLVALSDGGKTTRHNIAPACPRCNRSRGNRPLKEWYIRQPFFDINRYKRILLWMAGDSGTGQKRQ